LACRSRPGKNEALGIRARNAAANRLIVDSVDHGIRQQYQTSVKKTKRARSLSPPSRFYLHGDFDGGRAPTAMILDESRQDKAESAGLGGIAAAAIFTHSARSENH
jgi:hypothetical protein